MQKCPSYQPFSCTNCTILEGNIRTSNKLKMATVFIISSLAYCVHVMQHGTALLKEARVHQGWQCLSAHFQILLLRALQKCHMMPYGTSKCLISLGETWRNMSNTNRIGVLSWFSVRSWFPMFPSGFSARWLLEPSRNEQSIEFQKDITPSLW